MNDKQAAAHVNPARTLLPAGAVCPDPHETGRILPVRKRKTPQVPWRLPVAINSLAGC